LEGVTSLWHQVSGSGAAVNPISIMGWAGGVPQTSVLVRTIFQFIQNMYGVFAVIGGLDAMSDCYAATYDLLGNISLWKGNFTQILNGAISPLTTVVGTVPNPNDTYGIQLLTQYDASGNQMQLTVATTDVALAIPVTEGAGDFPDVTVRYVWVDPSPLAAGVNAGIVSIQQGSFAANTELSKFDITQIFV